MPEPVTERMLNDDIDVLSLAVDKACAQLNRLQAEKTELVAACEQAFGMWAWDKSGGGRAALDRLRAAIAKCEATS